MSKFAAKNAIILINGYNFSTYASSFETASGVNPIDVTGFTDDSQNFIPGPLSGSIKANLLWDSTAGSVHTALGSPTTGNVTVIPEGYTIGIGSYSMPFVQAQYGAKGDPASAVQVGQIEFMSYGDNAGVEFGNMLQHGTITNTTSTTGVLDVTDDAVTAECAMTLHIYTACADDTYEIKVEHSDTLGSGYDTLGTFTLDGSAIGSERITVASDTINKYRRVTATRTGSAGNTLGFSVHFWHS